MLLVVKLNVVASTLYTLNSLYRSLIETNEFISGAKTKGFIYSVKEIGVWTFIVSPLEFTSLKVNSILSKLIFANETEYFLLVSVFVTVEWSFIQLQILSTYSYPVFSLYLIDRQSV